MFLTFMENPGEMLHQACELPRTEAVRVARMQCSHFLAQIS